MSVLYMVVPLALVIAAVAVWAFVWSVKRGQFDDLETPALRMLHDDTATRRAPKPQNPKQSPSP
jgi:cbb3-type cytochrome oxidase maturation protein